MRESLDILIKDARIIDGTGNPFYKADIGIRKGRIVRISRNIQRGDAQRVIDANGLVASPGFFDAHSHDDAYLLLNPSCPEKVLQGVTTEVIGNCGLSLAPISPEHLEHFRQAFASLSGGSLPKDMWGISSFDDFLANLEELNLGINVVPLLGHGAIRVATMGLEDRAPTAAEMIEMNRLTEEAMKAGAFGLSTALILVPASFAKTEEMIQLAHVVGKYKGVYVTHIRSESDRVIEALEEALRIGRECKVPVHISHHKVAGKDNWGKSIATMSMLAEARDTGLEVTCDQYPYSAGSLYLAAALPPSVQHGGPEIYAKRLRDPEVRKSAIREIEGSTGGNWENLIKNCGFEGIIITASQSHSNYIGKSLAQIAVEENRNPYDVFFDLIVEEKAATIVILKMMDERDVKRIMENRLTMIGSDGLPGFGRSSFHPRMTGTFPRVLGRYVREQRLISLEEAIRKMTSFPAQTFGISNKGLLKEGFDADVVVFDPQTIVDTATYDNPTKVPEGISWVLLNGEVAAENGKVTGVTSGQVLRHRL